MHNFFKRLFGSKSPDTFEAVPTGVCPNRWGDLEYGNTVRKKYKDAQIAVNNKESRHAFIQDFVVTHLKGIQLKSTVHGTECPTCKMVYTD